MNKLLSILSAKRKDLTKDRQQRVVKGLKREQEAIVNALEAEVDLLQDKIEDSFDLGPTHSTQLKIDKIENPAEFMANIQAAKVKLAIKTQELAVAKDTLDEWFSDLKTTRTKVEKTGE